MERDKTTGGAKFPGPPSPEDKPTTTGGDILGPIEINPIEIDHDFPYPTEGPCCCGTDASEKPESALPEDNWQHRSDNMRCRTCMYYVRKEAMLVSMYLPPDVGRCRKHAPTIQGWPVMFGSDWCGDHKLDENKL